ncbi:MAG: hypothetical protein HN894_08685 [Bacteroidetes bacterium]|jgi:hypothetical protein|nr:hypothetical protein [Bacteroidota bacterium]
MNMIRFLILIGFILVHNNCTKSDDTPVEIDYDFILAGVSDSANYIQINDTITSDNWHTIYKLDINNDAINDFEFVSKSHVDQGGMGGDFSSSIHGINNTEIMVGITKRLIYTYTDTQLSDSTHVLDTLINSTDEIIPIILSQHDIVDSNGV